MAKLSVMRPAIRTIDTRTVKVAPKRADPELLTGAHRAWRKTVLQRAGFRCEYVEAGARCRKAAPLHRMFADHIIERRDGGDPLDPDNGQCLCGSHHTLKTAAQRARRMREG